MVESAADIIQGIAHLRGRKLEEKPAMPYVADKQVSVSDNELDSARRDILEKLSTTPVAVDELVDQCGIAAGTVMSILLELELAGRLKRSAGNKVYVTHVEATEEVA